MDQAPDQVPDQASTGALRGLRVLDLTRVLAGPTCTQMLGDLGAEIIKIERPGAGDDTRGFAPPFWPNTKESAYFLGANRNKKSVTLDIAKPEGQAIVHRLLARAAATCWWRTSRSARWPSTGSAGSSFRRNTRS